MSTTMPTFIYLFYLLICAATTKRGRIGGRLWREMENERRKVDVVVIDFSIGGEREGRGEEREGEEKWGGGSVEERETENETRTDAEREGEEKTRKTEKEYKLRGDEESVREEEEEENDYDDEEENKVRRVERERMRGERGGGDGEEKEQNRMRREEEERRKRRQRQKIKRDAEEDQNSSQEADKGRATRILVPKKWTGDVRLGESTPGCNYLGNFFTCDFETMTQPVILEAHPQVSGSLSKVTLRGIPQLTLPPSICFKQLYLIDIGQIKVEGDLTSFLTCPCCPLLILERVTISRIPQGLVNLHASSSNISSISLAQVKGIFDLAETQVGKLEVEHEVKNQVKIKFNNVTIRKLEKLHLSKKSSLVFENSILHEIKPGGLRLSSKGNALKQTSFEDKATVWLEGGADVILQDIRGQVTVMAEECPPPPPLLCPQSPPHPTPLHPHPNSDPPPAPTPHTHNAPPDCLSESNLGGGDEHNSDIGFLVLVTLLAVSLIFNVTQLLLDQPRKALFTLVCRHMNKDGRTDSLDEELFFEGPYRHTWRQDSDFLSCDQTESSVGLCSDNSSLELGVGQCISDDDDDVFLSTEQEVQGAKEESRPRISKVPPRSDELRRRALAMSYINGRRRHHTVDDPVSNSYENPQEKEDSSTEESTQGAKPEEDSSSKYTLASSRNSEKRRSLSYNGP